MLRRLNLVTGARGFVGRYLVRALAEGGERVRVLVRGHGPPEPLAEVEGVEIHRGDITDPTSLRGVCQGVSRVYHLAASGHVSAVSAAAHAEFMRVNVEGTRNLLSACAGQGVERFVHFSSTAAMGLIKKALIDERDAPQPVTPYQKSKLASEGVALGLGGSLAIPSVVVRPCMIYGVGGKGEFYKQAQLMRRGLFPRVGLGMNLTPLVHVRDVVKGALLAAERGRPGEIYLLASERSLPLDEMRGLIMQGWGTRTMYPFVPTPVMLGIAYAFEKWSRLSGSPPLATRQNIASTVGNRQFSIRKSQVELGYSPDVPFAEGIAETVRWFKAGAP